VRRDDARRYAAPAALLLAVTVAVVLIHSALHAGSSAPSAVRTSTPPTHRHRTVRSRAAKAKAKPKPRHRATAAQYYTVQAGDTFGVISSKTGVPVATIEQLNPSVSSSMLTIGQKIRIR
jgi:LysM repeat protein